MKKRALSLLLAFVMTLGLAVPAFAAEAPDAPFDELEAQDIDLAAPTEPEAPVPVEEAEEPAPAEPMDVPAPAAEDVMPIDVPVAAAASTVTYNSGHGWADAVRKGADAELSAYVVEDSDKVTLQQDVDLAKYINPQSGDLTIDLAGHTLSMNAGTLVYVTGTNVTIMSSKPGGRVYSRLVDGKPTSDNGNALAVYGGSLKIGKNVTVEENGYKHPTFMIYGNGSLTIEQGAAVTADIANENPEKPVGVIQIGATESYPSKGTLTLNGEVNATNLNHAIVVAYDGSEVTIGEGAKIKTNDGDGVVAMNNNTITMTGGAIEVGADTMTSIGLQTAKGTISISGNSKISGGVYGVATGGKLTITGGEITNTMVGIGTNGSESGTAEINVTNATVSGTVAGVYLAAGQMTLGTGAKVSGQAGVVFRGGKLTVNDGATVTGTGGDVTVGDATLKPAEEGPGAQRYSVPGAAITVDNASYPYYTGEGSVTISGEATQIIGAANERVLVYTENGTINSTTDTSNIFTIPDGMKFNHSIDNLRHSGYQAFDNDASNETPYSFHESEPNKDTLRKDVGSTITKLDDSTVNTVYQVTWEGTDDAAAVKSTEVKVGGKTLNPAHVFDGESVTATVTPNETYSVRGKLTIDPATVEPTKNEGGTGTVEFTMPKSDVTITATLAEKNEPAVEVDTPEPSVTTAPGVTLPQGFTTENLEKISVSNEEKEEDEKKLTEVAEQEAKKVTDEKVKEVVEKLEGAQSAENIVIRAVTTIDTKVEGYDTDNNVLQLDITPQYQVIATTADNKDTPVDKLTENTDKVTLVEEQPLPNKDSLVITLTVPVPAEVVDNTTDDANPVVYIKHVKDNGRAYLYTGKASYADSAWTVTFTTEHGFSSFYFGKTPDVEAEIDSTQYPTLQDAVYTVAESTNGATIKLRKAPASKDVYLPGSNYSFTIDAFELTGSAETTLKGLGFKAASGYTYSTSAVADGKLTVTVSYSGGGSSGGGGGGTTAVDKSALKAAIAAAQALKGEEYTTDSWSALETALAAAKTVDDNAAATQAQVNAALAALTTARSGLVKKGEEPGPGGEILPPAGGTGWRWVEDEQTYYYFKDGKRVGDYWIGFADGGSAWPNNWYYADANGRLLTGFQYLDDLKGGKAWYMLQTDNTNGTMGKMLTGWQWTYITAVGTGYFSPKYGSQGACTYTTEWGEYNAAAGLWGDGQSHTGK